MEQDKLNKVREVAAKVGIPTALLDELGYTELLLAGEVTPLTPVWIERDSVVVWMLGRLRLGEDESGEMIIEVDGLTSEEEQS